MRQLPLGVRLADRALFESFLPAGNAPAVAAARALAAGGVERLLYLHGVAGAGKSHLLQAACAATPGAAYLPLAALRPLGAAALEGLALLPLVAIDDLGAVAGDAAWERGLFGLYNDLAAAGGRLLVAAHGPAGELGLALPDLVSRLAAMPHFALRVLDETGQREALRLRAGQRGIELPDEILTYLQRRFARDMASLYALLDRLDAASLREQRRLTVPFIREVLEEGS